MDSSRALEVEPFYAPVDVLMDYMSKYSTRILDNVVCMSYFFYILWDIDD